MNAGQFYSMNSNPFRGLICVDKQFTPTISPCRGEIFKKKRSPALGDLSIRRHSVPAFRHKQAIQKEKGRMEGQNDKNFKLYSRN